MVNTWREFRWREAVEGMLLLFLGLAGLFYSGQDLGLW